MYFDVGVNLGVVSSDIGFLQYLLCIGPTEFVVSSFSISSGSLFAIFNVVLCAIMGS